MAEKAKNKVKNEVGCGFVGRIFLLRSHRLRNSSVHSLPMKPTNNVQSNQTKTESKNPPNNESKALRNISTESHKPNSDQKPPRKSTSGHRRPSDAARSSTSSSSGNSISTHTKNDESKLQREPIENSLVLARISTSQQRDKENKGLVNLKLTGNLVANNSPRSGISITKKVECVPKSKESNFMTSSYNNAVMGNIMRKNSDDVAQFRSPRNRVDPEVLKTMGNEAYKQGKLEEALSLYNQAIRLDSNKATYHCNKSAALMGLGRLLEALVECEEAIRLEPSYTRAHHRLATIYLR